MAITSSLTKHNSNKALSIQINLSGLSFCVLNLDTNTVENLEAITFDSPKNAETLLDTVKTIFNTHSALKHAFNSVTVIHQNLWQTLVPKALFNKENLTDYLKYNTRILANDLVDYDEINSIEACSVYVPFTNINNYIFEKFGSFTFKHASTVLIEAFSLVEKNKSETTVYIHIEDNTFDLIVFTNGKLILSNIFNYTNEQDFIYYILFTFEQLQINTETVNVFLLGKVKKDGILYKIAYTYIRHIELYQPNYTFTFKTEPKHEYFNILNSLLCE